MSESPGTFRRHPLDTIFAPRNVAVIGATETPGSVGRTLLRNLISHPFGGAVFPVNPRRASVLGIHSYRDILSVPAPVDLAVIVTPAPTVPEIIDQCVEAGVKGAIIISAGFREIGERGAALERAVLERARSARMRIIGPNCLGVMSPTSGLNATFAKGMALPGSVGFISQSGALCTAILDWSFRERVGFSAFVSVGSMLDVDWGDLIYYLGDDDRTRSIVMYMESIGNARSFLSAAREVSLTKPIIVIKAGRSEAAAKAAASHTGSMAGSDDVLDAAFRRCGVLRVEHLSHLFAMAEVLAKQPRPAGPRLTILTNAGGPGVLATDMLIAGNGELARLSDDSMAAFDQVLPRHWSHNNPIDIIGDAGPDRYAKAVRIAANDSNTDGLLVILTPQDMTSPTQTAEDVAGVLGDTPKPVLACWMGGPDVEGGIDVLNRANIPTFEYPDTAASVFNYMWRYADNLRAIYETPSSADAAGGEVASRQRAAALIDAARGKGRTLLTEFESKQVFAAYGIPTVRTELAATPDEAVACASAIGYPVVLKLNSETITHKSDVQGVQLGLEDEAAVRRAWSVIETAVGERAGPGHFQGVTVQPMERLDGYELIVGCSQDAQFGPVLLFGTGGTLVEVFRDRALGLPPLNTTLARRMMESTRIFDALKGIRGRTSVDIDALDQLLVRFSHLVVEQPRIREIDINPLLASPDRLVALDARIVLHEWSVADRDLPRSSIRPYPMHYRHEWSLPDGTVLTIRPIRPEDEPLMSTFTLSLAPHDLYLRYFRPVVASTLASHDQLTRLCFVDYDREMSLVALHEAPGATPPAIVAHGQLTRIHGRRDAEFSVQVHSRYQGSGLGTHIVSELIDIARKEGLETIVAEIMPENESMRGICTRLGFSISVIPDSANLLVEKRLDDGKQ
jgi:acetyltransferase